MKKILSKLITLIENSPVKYKEIILVDYFSNDGTTELTHLPQLKKSGLIIPISYV